MTAKKILIADDDRDLAQSLAVRCEAMGLQAVCASDCLSAVTLAQRESPDLLCIDVDMPGGSGLNVCEMLSADPRWSGVPVIVLTGRRDPATIRRCQSLSADYVLKGFDIWAKLGPLLTRLLEVDPNVERPSPSTPVALGTTDDGDPEDLAAPRAHRILVIDDDPEISLGIEARLVPYGIEVLRAFSGMNGYWAAIADPPNAIVIDMSMPDGDGNYILSRLRNHPRTATIPTIVLTGERNPAQKRHMLSAGATQYLLKPMVFDELLAELRQVFPIDDVPLPTAGGLILN